MNLTPSKYLLNKELQTNSLFKILKGKGFYIINGKPVPKVEFESLYPIDLPLQNKPFKGENSDRTKSWMSDKKSY